MEDVKSSNQAEDEDLYHDSNILPGNGDSPSPTSSLRRRSLSCHVPGYDSSNFFPSRNFENYLNSRDRKFRFSRKLMDIEKDKERILENSTISENFDSHLNVGPQMTDVKNPDNLGDVDSHLREADTASYSNILLDLTSLVLKAVTFQASMLVTFTSLMIKFFTFPLWLIYSSCIFVMDPFRIMRRVKQYILHKFVSSFGFVFEWLKDDHYSMWRFWLKLGWGLLWSVYVWAVLVGLLISAFIIAGILMRILSEEPIRMKETLNFDYTAKSPVAYVPMLRGSSWTCGMDREGVEVEKLDGVRVTPPNHRLHIAVTLTLPESDYNRNLGIFQVRADFLAANGKVLSSLRHPCMLHFKSYPIRLLSTLLKAVPLLTGFISESQELKVHLRDFTEGDIPTACLRLAIEQRAEFHLGGGIPEIYAASLIIKSELPLLKRMIWNWKTTLFVWVSMTIFAMELLFALLCCKSLIIPRVRLRHSSNSTNTSRNNQPIQR